MTSCTFDELVDFHREQADHRQPANLWGKMHAPLWSPAVMSYRDNQHVERHGGTALLDLDKTPLSFRDWQGVLAECGHAAILYSTTSSTPERNRSRALVLLRPLAVTELDAAWHALWCEFGGHGDRQCSDHSRAYTMPQRWMPTARGIDANPQAHGSLLWWQGGSPVDIDALVRKHPLPPKPVYAPVEARVPATTRLERYARAALDRIISEISAIPPNAGRHGQMLKAGRCLGQIIGGTELPGEPYRNALMEAAEQQAARYSSQTVAKDSRRAISDGFSWGLRHARDLSHVVRIPLRKLLSGVMATRFLMHGDADELRRALMLACDDRGCIFDDDDFAKLIIELRNNKGGK